MGIDQDVGRCAELAEHAQDFLDVSALLRPGEQLAVGVGSRSAFAEGVVALGIHAVVARDAGYVLAPFMHVLAAFQHDGPPAQFDEAQGGKQSARAGTYHNDARGLAHVGVDHRLEVESGRHLVDVEVEAQVDVDGALAGVDASAADAQGLDGARIDGQFGRGLADELPFVGRYVGRDPQVELLLHDGLLRVGKGLSGDPAAKQRGTVVVGVGAG